MKNAVFAGLLCLLVGGCNGQKNEKLNKDKQTEIADTSQKPKVDIRVNKKFDDKGNLVAYDSTYSYFYSSPNGIRGTIGSDSLFGNFKGPLFNEYNNLWNNGMNGLFFNDSLYKYDFYNDDYFSKRFELNRKWFENMFWQMDSMKADMFRRQYPEGKIKKN